MTERTERRGENGGFLVARNDDRVRETLEDVVVFLDEGENATDGVARAMGSAAVAAEVLVALFLELDDVGEGVEEVGDGTVGGVAVAGRQGDGPGEADDDLARRADGDAPARGVGEALAKAPRHVLGGGGVGRHGMSSEGTTDRDAEREAAGRGRPAGKSTSRGEA